MSKIWDALRQAERAKNRSVQAGDEQTQHDLMPGQHSTKCVLANAPVSVYGYGITNTPFYEQAEAVSVDAGGGMIMLANAVNSGQILLLTNEVNLREEKCVVRESSQTLAGLGSCSSFFDQHLIFGIPFSPESSCRRPKH